MLPRKFLRKALSRAFQTVNKQLRSNEISKSNFANLSKSISSNSLDCDRCNSYGIHIMESTIKFIESTLNHFEFNQRDQWIEKGVCAPNHVVWELWLDKLETDHVLHSMQELFRANFWESHLKDHVNSDQSIFTWNLWTKNVFANNHSLSSSDRGETKCPRGQRQANTVDTL